MSATTYGPFSLRETRLGRLNELIRTRPIAILAETLGYSPQTQKPTEERPHQRTRGTWRLGWTDDASDAAHRLR